MRLALLGVDSGPLEVRTEVAADGDVIAWFAANPADLPVAVRQVALRWRVTDVQPPLRTFRNGWQSWSPTDVVTVGEAEDPSRAEGSFPFVRDIHGADPVITGEGERGASSSPSCGTAGATRRQSASSPARRHGTLRW